MTSQVGMSSRLSDLKTWQFENISFKTYMYTPVLYQHISILSSYYTAPILLLIMPYSGILRRVALERIDVSEERTASIVRVTRIRELETTLAVSSNRHTLVFLRSVRRLLDTTNVLSSSPILVTPMMEAPRSYESSALTRTTWRNFPDEVILHSHRSENLNSSIALTGWTLQLTI
jgi:hypothetical protein